MIQKWSVSELAWRYQLPTHRSQLLHSIPLLIGEASMREIRAQPCRMHWRQERKTMRGSLACPIFECMLCLVYRKTRNAYDWASLGAPVCIAMRFALGDLRSIACSSLDQVAAPYASLLILGLYGSLAA